MALRCKRKLGSGRFRSLTSLVVLVLQVAVVGLADANNRNNMASSIESLIPATPAFQSYCSQLLEGSEEVMVQVASISERPYSSTFGLCLRIRGGRLGFGRSDTTVSPSTTAIIDNVNSTSGSGDVDDDGPEISSEESSSPGPTSADDLPPSSRKYIFSLFQENDGSQKDPDGIPTRYLKMQSYKRKEAKAALKSTLKWREENDIDTILARPHPLYDACKSIFPHYFCGRDETNHVILLQRPGMIDLKRAAKNGVTGKELLFHYVYVMEYLWQILEPRADETMTSIMDLKGISLSILGKPELLGIVQMFCSVMDSHFPQRGHKMLLINSPKWFGTIYKVLSPLLREETKNKIFIYSKGKKQDAALQSLLKDCGGPDDTSNMALIEPTEMESDMRNFVS